MEFLITIYTINIISLFFLLTFIHVNKAIDNNRKKAFLYAVICTVVIILTELGTILVAGRNSNFFGLNIFFNIIGFSLAPFLPIILISIFSPKILRTHPLLLVPTLINTLASLLSPFFGLVFSVDASNNYQRGSFFFIFIIVYIINIVLFVIITWNTIKKHFSPIKWKILGLSLFAVAGTLIQIFVPQVYSSWHCVTVVLLLLYILLLDFENSFDALTGLYNRTAFEKELENLENKNTFTIIMMDVNDFKIINDTYGHEYGDLILKEFSEILRTSFDSNCSHYRIGGDEFCTIYKITNQEKIEYLFEKLHNNLVKKRETSHHFPTVAYGYSVFKKQDGSDVKKTLNDADEKMYQHKRKLKKENTLILKQ